jgi:hypothetical protein
MLRTEIERQDISICSNFVCFEGFKKMKKAFSLGGKKN